MERKTRILIALFVFAALAVTGSLYTQHRHEEVAMMEYQRLTQRLVSCEAAASDNDSITTCLALRQEVRRAESHLRSTPERKLFQPGT